MTTPKLALLLLEGSLASLSCLDSKCDGTGGNVTVLEKKVGFDCAYLI